MLEKDRKAPRQHPYLTVILDVFSRFVPRHKTTVLFPDPLCGRRWRRPVMTGAHGSVVVLSGT